MSCKLGSGERTLGNGWMHPGIILDPSEWILRGGGIGPAAVSQSVGFVDMILSIPHPRPRTVIAHDPA